MKWVIKYLFLIGFVCHTPLLFAQMQSSQITMLLQKLQSTNDKTEKTRILNELSRENSEINPREARRYAEEALALTTSIGDKIGETQALLCLGKAYFYLGDYPQAKAYYLSALDYCESLELKNSEAEALRGIADSFSALSRQYYDQNETEKAEKYQNYYFTYLRRYQNLIESPVRIFGSPRLTEKPKTEKTNEKPINKDTSLNEQLTKEQKREILEEIKNSETPRNLANMTEAERNEEIKHLRFEKQKKDQQLTKLMQENLQKEEVLERQNTFLLAGIVMLLGIVLSSLVYFTGNIYNKNRLNKNQQLQIKEQKNQLNKQKIWVNENEENLRKKDAELLNKYSQIDNLHIENQSVAYLLKEELQPQISSISALAQHEKPNLEIIKQNTTRIKNIIDTAIAVQELSKNPPVFTQITHDIKKVAQSAITQFEQVFTQKNIILYNNIADNLSTKFEEKHLENVFVSLLENAVKYAPNDSSVILEGKFLENGQENLIQITQQDFGKQIPKESQHFAFDKIPPRDARPSAWGLAYIKLMVEAQKGKVEVKSDKESTIFSLILKA